MKSIIRPIEFVSPLSEVKNLDEKDKLLQDQQEEIKNQ